MRLWKTSFIIYYYENKSLIICFLVYWQIHLRHLILVVLVHPLQDRVVDALFVRFLLHSLFKGTRMQLWRSFMILMPEGDHAPVSLPLLNDRGHGLLEGNMLGVDFKFEFIEDEGVVLVRTDDQALLRLNLSAIESECADFQCLDPNLKVKTVELWVDSGVISQEVKVDEPISRWKDQSLRSL